MTRCTGARQRASAALLAAAAAATVPWSALGAEAAALPSAGSATVIPEPGRPSGPTPPGSGAAGTGPATSGSGSGAATPSPPTGSTPRAVDPSSSARDIGSPTTTTTVDWFVRASALLGELVTLALAVVCGLLAWASFVVLREALGMAPRPVVADPPASAPPAQADSKVADASPPPSAAKPASPAAKAPPDFAFKRHWGGFGGGSTGWVVSERLVRVIVGLALAGLAAALGMQLVPRDGSSGKAGAASSSGAASAAKAHD
jgi:hypothetical protein